MLGYCLKCQAQRQMLNMKHSKAPKTKQPMVKGECKKCGSTVCKFVVK